jgi:hypothetical protein
MRTLHALASAEPKSQRNQLSNADGRRRTNEIHGDAD